MIDIAGSANTPSEMFNLKSTAKFLKPKLVESIRKNLEIINDYLSGYLKIIVDKENENKEIKKRPFFSLDILKDLGKFNYINFSKKKYFFVIENNDLQEKTKLEMQVFVLNMEDDIIKNHNNKKEYIGVQIFQNGRLFAGKFNESGKLNSYGIHINKKGNLICGI
jgi:hypothetical protein